MGKKKRRACHHRRHHRCALCLSHAAVVWHATSVATAARVGAAGGTASPRHVRSPLRRSCLEAPLALWHSRAACAVHFIGAGVTLVLTRTAAQAWATSRGVSLRCSPSRRSVCRSAGGVACPRAMHVRVVRCGGLGRALCAVLLCHATGRLLPRLGGRGGAVPTAALAAPDFGVASWRSAPWPMCRRLPGGLARSASASAVRAVWSGGDWDRSLGAAAVWRLLRLCWERNGLCVVVVCSCGVRSIVVWSRMRSATHATHTTGHRASRGDITARSRATWRQVSAAVVRIS